MFKTKSRPHVYIDVDDTLVMWSNHDKGPIVKINYDGYTEEAVMNTHNIDHLKKMARRGHVVIVWSAGGVDWAEAVVKALGIEEYVHAVLSKPDYYVDDIKDPKHWIGKYGYYKLDGTLIRSDKSCVQLEE